MALKEAILKQYEYKSDWKNFYKNLTHGRSDNKIWTDKDFEHLTEEEISVGNFNCGGIFTITVNGSEGETAHFHFYTNDGRKGCFKIGVPEHFNHGIYKDRLNNKELKIMIDWLKQKPTKICLEHLQLIMKQFVICGMLQIKNMLKHLIMQFLIIY